MQEELSKNCNRDTVYLWNNSLINFMSQTRPIKDKFSYLFLRHGQVDFIFV